jgi:catechol 2,3-dioxygenase-like lactoylglutathione lyase family enzyme
VGGRDNGPPGVREQYSSEEGGRYYAAFVLDPDGNNIEAVCREF